MHHTTQHSTEMSGHHALCIHSIKARCASSPLPSPSSLERHFSPSTHKLHTRNEEDEKDEGKKAGKKKSSSAAGGRDTPLQQPTQQTRMTPTTSKEAGKKKNSSTCALLDTRQLCDMLRKDG